MKILKFHGKLLEATLDEILNMSKLEGIQWSRFQEFNKILKGFRPSELTVLSGKTGIGKTTFLCEYSLDLAKKGVRTLWGSFEIPLPRICNTMLRQYATESLTKAPQKRIQFWADEFAQNVPLYFMNYQGSQSEDSVLKLMESGVKDLHVDHIIIDNIQFMLGSQGNVYQERFQRQDRFVGALRTFATTHKCHLTVVVHPRKEESSTMLTVNSLYGGGKISQESDNILLMQETDNVVPKKFVQVAKNRFDGTLGNVDLKFDRDRKSYRPETPKSLIDRDQEIITFSTRE